MKHRHPVPGESEVTMNNNLRKVWCMMDACCNIISEEHEEPDDVITEMLWRYTRQEMHENGFTLNLLLCDDYTWYECIAERNDY